jgi:hypothetical protein
MQFERYADIASCRQHAFFANFEVAADQKFVIQEKVDGANIQLGFAPDCPYFVGRRNGALKMGERFFDLWTTLGRCKPWLDVIQQFVDEGACSASEIDQHRVLGAWFELPSPGQPEGLEPSVRQEWVQDPPCLLRLYGELCGPGVNGRVKYGAEQRIVLFDAKLRGKMLSPQQFVVLMARLGIPQGGHPDSTQSEGPIVLVPVLGSAMGLDEALKFDCGVDSKILGQAGNTCEGGVIKPWDTVMYNARGQRLYCKNVNPSFQETTPFFAGRSDRSLEAAPQSGASYLTRNRALSVISKEGTPKNVSLLAKHVKALLEDAQKAYREDHPAATDKDVKQAFRRTGGLAHSLFLEFCS